MDQSSLIDRPAKGANLKNVIIGQAVLNALLEGGVPGGMANVSECKSLKWNRWKKHYLNCLQCPNCDKRTSVLEQDLSKAAPMRCPQGCPLKEKAKEISISLKNVTVRESLNAIARVNGHAVWRFRQSESGGRKYFSLDFASK